MSHEGFYILINTNAPAKPHTYFGQSVGLVEFLESVLGEGSIRVREEECKRYSTFMGLLIEAYQKNDLIVFMTDCLFSAEEAALFAKVYMLDNFEGIHAQLVQRRDVDFSSYVKGRIALSLATGLAINGRLDIDFSIEGVISLPYLHEASMHYTSPQPGHFRRVEVEPRGPSISFYI